MLLVIARPAVTADRVDIRAEGALTGDGTASRISIEDGAYFKGGSDIKKSDVKTAVDAKTFGAGSATSAPEPPKPFQL